MAADGEDSAVVEYARYLGIEPHEDAALMHIAREAVVAELPPGWEEHTDDDGNPFYFNEKEDRSIWEHPCDAHYRGLVLQARQAVERPSKAVTGAQGMLLESMNHVAANGDGTIKLGVLPLARFLNGHTFFVQHAHTLPNAAPPLSVHMTYQFAEGSKFAYGKRQRLRQARRSVVAVQRRRRPGDEGPQGRDRRRRHAGLTQVRW
mgnify:CR=1 FL=1